ncbi:MAG: SDR family oxidoreductase [Gammaproteobacteria bacterium]
MIALSIARHSNWLRSALGDEEGVDTPMLKRAFGDNPQFAEAAAAAEPIGRLAQPAEIGEAVVWLCSDGASFVTGLPMAVDGGWVA